MSESQYQEQNERPARFVERARQRWSGERKVPGRQDGYASLLYSRVRTRLAEPGARGITVALLGAALLLLVFLVYWTVLVVQVPPVAQLRDARIPEATIAYTADGEELTRYHIENRTWVPLDSISQHVVDALVATEDHRFFRHEGIDVWRVVGAVFGTARGERQGGSTLSMQLARNVYPDMRDDFILTRKMKEWLTATRLEDVFTKEELLERYLNTVPFMYDAVGIEAAARTYFQKHAHELDLLESATLVGMLKATVYYNPVRQPERSHLRRNTVLQQMVRNGYLDEAAYAALRDRPTELRFRRLTRQDNLAPYFAEYLRQWLDAWAETKGYNLYTDGLRVYTTLDADLQRAAEAAVAEMTEALQAVVDVEWSTPRPFTSARAEAYRAVRDETEPFAYFWETNDSFLQALLRQSQRYRALVSGGAGHDAALAAVRADTAYVDSLKAAHERLEAGFIAMDPRNGFVRAYVGGRDFRTGEYDHVVQARRQPGSTFKPFVYAAALENGFTPHSTLVDRVVAYTDPHTGKVWRPRNFGNVSGSAMSLRHALAHSKNTITAQLITRVGPARVVDIAHKMGIESDLMAVPSLGLGTSEVTLLEMATAYSTLASQGIRHRPVFVTRIEDRAGNVLASFAPQATQAIPARTAYGVLDMMRGTVEYGTAVRMRSMFGARGDLAGKTGTTQNAADGWFMLVHPQLVMGAWMGFNTQNVTFRSRYWGQGAHNALHVVGSFYQKARDAEPEVLATDVRFEQPEAYFWGPGIHTDADRLNSMERRSNRLGEVIRKMRQQRGGD